MFKGRLISAIWCLASVSGGFGWIFSSANTLPRFKPLNTTFEDCTDSSMDLVILLDSSGSVGSTNFLRFKQLMIEVVSAVNIDDGMARVAVVTFSTSAKVEFLLDDFSTNKGVQKAIKGIVYEGGFTNIVSGLSMVYNTVFQRKRGDRPDVRNVLLLIVDGPSTEDSSLTIPTATLVKESGVHIFVVGIQEADIDEITGIASEPTEVNCIKGHFDDLENIADYLFKTMCTGIVRAETMSSSVTTTATTTATTTVATTTAPSVAGGRAATANTTPASSTTSSTSAGATTEATSFSTTPTGNASPVTSMASTTSAGATTEATSFSTTPTGNASPVSSTTSTTSAAATTTEATSFSATPTGNASPVTSMASKTSAGATTTKATSFSKTPTGNASPVTSMASTTSAGATTDATSISKTPTGNASPVSSMTSTTSAGATTTKPNILSTTGATATTTTTDTITSVTSTALTPTAGFTMTDTTATGFYTSNACYRQCEQMATSTPEVIDDVIKDLQLPKRELSKQIGEKTSTSNLSESEQMAGKGVFVVLLAPFAFLVGWDLLDLLRYIDRRYINNDREGMY
ncbi:mucin-17-like [Haliotis rufescens]|uniref:mucin-17-like n=1 Tax=Haliotis rufescens TaxID=6454 RepID=UPI00201E939B|nr:mucin-17-like [Haliotis rufescens]